MNHRDHRTVPDKALATLEMLLADGAVEWGTQVEPHFHVASNDAIRLFALGTGDDNPLYTDAVHAEASVRRGVLAPPLFVLATGEPRTRGQPLPADVAAALIPGASIAEENWTFLRPVLAGDRLERFDTIIGAARAPNVRTPGASFELVQRTTWSANGAVHAYRQRLRAHGAGQNGQRRTHKATYDDRVLEEIAAAYDRETRRGARTRVADEIRIGDPLGPIVRGPLTVTDLVTYRAAVGPGPLRAGVLRIGHLNRRRDGRFFSRNDVGAFETAERLHWDEAHARQAGHPTAYDYSHTRQVWLSQMLTDWVGDGGWVARLAVSAPGMNYVGDTHWLTGEVVDTEPSGSDLAVTVSLRATNQLGDVTCYGDATLLIPARRDLVADHLISDEFDAPEP